MNIEISSLLCVYEYVYVRIRLFVCLQVENIIWMQKTYKIPKNGVEMGYEDDLVALNSQCIFISTLEIVFVARKEVEKK